MKPISALFTAAFVCVAITVSCGKDPRMSYPNVYRNAGIAFSYPDGWTVAHDGSDPMRFIAVRSASGAMLTIHLIREEKAPAVDVFASQYARYAGGLAADANGTSEFGEVGRGRDSQNIVERFIRMRGEKPVPHTRVFWRGYSGSYAVFITAESSEAEPDVAAKFDTIIASLRYDLK